MSRECRLQRAWAWLRRAADLLPRMPQGPQKDRLRRKMHILARRTWREALKCIRDS